MKVRGLNSLGAKLAASVGVLLLIFAAAVLIGVRRHSKQDMKDVMVRQTEQAREFDLAIRKYVEDTIRPFAQQHVGDEEFLPELMSSTFIARSIFEDVHKKCPDLVLKFSSNNPRNPANQAGPGEIEILEYFRRNPDQTRWTGEIDFHGERHYVSLYARRMEASCLQCHGKLADAPAGMIARYGDTMGFNRTVGDVIAMDTVAVPVDREHLTMARATFHDAAMIFAGVIGLFIVLVFIIRRLVTRRLAVITSYVKKIEQQDRIGDMPPLDIKGSDEISVLADGFNNLLRRLQDAHGDMEQRVARRTAELTEANDQLKSQTEELAGSRKIALSIMEDLSELNDETDRVNQELAVAVAQAEEMAKAAEAANEAKSQFLANMSHEIRTPMTAILGFTEQMQSSDVSAEDRADYLDVVGRNGRYLLELINDILDLSKVESGKMEMELIPHSIAATVAEVASTMRVRANQKNVELSVEYATPIPEIIRTDPARLRQALVNLVGNAVKFTSHGEVKVVVSFCGHDSDEANVLRIDVVDTGIGIPSGKMESLFDPFAQADSSSTRIYGGTGLGLAITKNIADLLGGDVSVQSVLGEGSRFTLTIPADCPDGTRMLHHPSEAVESVHALPQHDDGEPLAGIRILLAEDGPDNQLLISAVLTKVGAQVEIAGNGKIAVQKVRTEGKSGFDVILMDMQMPEIDGYHATRILRQDGVDCPIIALTAHAMDGDREKCLAAGCTDYSSKPIDREGLIATIVCHVLATRSKGSGSASASQPSASHPEIIRSSSGDDPDLAEIIGQFVEKLPTQITAMAKALANNDYDELRILAYRLKGSGGGYGYACLTEVARTVEAAAKASDTEAATLALNELRKLVDAIVAGWQQQSVAT